jgi:hypothetical protein
MNDGMAWQGNGIREWEWETPGTPTYPSRTLLPFKL